MILLECPGLVYFAILFVDWMPAGPASAGPVGVDHIEVGPVVAGHIEVSLCSLSPRYHT